MPHGVAVLASLAGKPGRVRPPAPPPADAPWSRPDATVLADLRQVERDDRARTMRPFEGF
jgi:hypothetical protein